jgi:hypothetical protein
VEVAVAEEDPVTTDLELLRLIDLIGLSPDLLGAFTLVGAGARDDDPCAPTGGTPPADGCPPGAPGTVLFTDPLPPFWMNAQAHPRTHAELRDGAGRDLGSLFCEPAETGEGEVGLRIRATAPGTWNVNYWPTDSPSDVRTLSATNSDEQIADWMVEADDIDHGFWITELCVVMPDIVPGTPYTAVVSGGDIFGREAAPHTVLFHSDGAPQHPAVQLQTVGQNLLLASAAHRPDERVETMAYLIDDGSVLDCADPGVGTLSPLTRVLDVAVGEAEQLRQNITDDNTLKDVRSYRVPEGATLQFCARWFPGDSAPEWESAQATHQSWAIVQSADRLLPVLTLVGFEPRDDRSVSVGFATNTAEGLRCDTLPWSSGMDFGQTLCGDWQLAGGGAGTDGDRLFDRGFTGDLVVRTTAELSSGETSESTVVLPAGAGGCVGVCTAPDAQRFGISTIGGTAIVEQTWVTGLRNGRTDWYIGTVESQPVDYVRPDTPQLDRSADWEYSEPTLSAYLSASIRIPVDRPVSWTFVQPHGDPTGETEIPCVDGVESFSLSGTSETVGSAEMVTIRLPQVCMGGSYTPILTLTDEAGNVSTWSIIPGVAANWWGGAGLLTPPRAEVTVRYRVDVWDVGWRYLREYQLIAGTTVSLTNDYADPEGSRCTRDDGIIKSEGRFDNTVGPLTSLGLVYLSDHQRYSGGDGCLAYASDEVAVPEVIQVPISELRNPDGVILVTSTGARVHIWVELR